MSGNDVTLTLLGVSHDVSAVRHVTGSAVKRATLLRSSRLVTDDRLEMKVCKCAGSSDWEEIRSSRSFWPLKARKEIGARLVVLDDGERGQPRAVPA